MAGGNDSIFIYMTRPKKLTAKNQAALVWAHRGNGCWFNAELFMPETNRIALEYDCIVFSVDYRKGPEVRTPGGMEDFALAIEHVH